VVPGLADPNCYSLAAVNVTGYLRHSNFRLRVDADNGTATFRQDATYCARPGAAGGSVMLESYNNPGFYIRHYNYELRIDRYADNATYRNDASFTSVTAWA
jgi:hypothetical protein